MDAADLLEHYIEYITNPTVLITILVLVAPILYTVGVERRLATRSRIPTGIPGCLRLGLSGASKLSQQYEPQRPSPEDVPRVQALFTYPIKSCRGVELGAAEVEATGLKYDRLFTFAQLVSKPSKGPEKDGESAAEPGEKWEHQWRFITMREFPRLALLRTELWVPDPRGRATVANGKALQVPNGRPRTRSRTRGNTLVGQLERGSRPSGNDWAAQGGCLIVRFPYKPDHNYFGLRTEENVLTLPLAPTSHRAESKGYATESLSIWKDDPQAINVTPEIDSIALDKLRYFLGVSNPLALFRVDDMNKRAVSRCLPTDGSSEYKVGFADAFPVNLMGLASVRQTDAELPAGVNVKGKLDARRFRANVYVSGTAAYAEDEWKKIILGKGVDDEGRAAGEAEFHVACRTARCKLPNVNPDTGVKDKNEPYTTLGKTRKVDKGAYPHPCLGMQTIPLFQRGVVRVGDEVTVLERGEHCYEKMFS